MLCSSFIDFDNTLKARIVKNVDINVKSVYGLPLQCGCGTKPINAYKREGVLYLHYQIKNGKIKNVSKPRRDMRLTLLQDGKQIENFNKGLGNPIKNNFLIAFKFIHMRFNTAIIPKICGEPYFKSCF